MKRGLHIAIGLLALGGLLCVLGMAMFNLPMFAVGLVCLVAGMIVRLFDRRARKIALQNRASSAEPHAEHCCQQCGYELRHIPGVFCPECGFVRPRTPA